MKLLPLVLSTALLGGAALAQSVPSSSQVQFEAETGPVTVTSSQPPIPNADQYRVKVADLDKNGDGYLTRSEIPADHALAFEFRLVDRNRDGRITDEELANWK